MAGTLTLHLLLGGDMVAQLNYQSDSPSEVYIRYLRQGAAVTLDTPAIFRDPQALRRELLARWGDEAGDRAFYAALKLLLDEAGAWARHVSDLQKLACKLS